MDADTNALRPQGGVDPDTFRHALAQLAGGVVVVTSTDPEGVPAGGPCGPGGSGPNRSGSPVRVTAPWGGTTGGATPTASTTRNVVRSNTDNRIRLECGV